MIGTSRACSKETLDVLPFSCTDALFPVIYPLPSASQSLDWVLMLVAAGHLGRPQSQLGGSISPARYLLCPLLCVLSCTIWDQPPSCLAQRSPQTSGLFLLTPGLSLACHPSPHTAPRRSVLPPLHSALCSCRASPIPPHVVLISTQRTSVKTTNYVDTRAEFTQEPRTPSLCSHPCIFRLDIIPNLALL